MPHDAVRMELTQHQQRLLAAEAFVDTRTLRRFLSGEEIRPSSEERILIAAKKLKLRVTRRKKKS